MGVSENGVYPPKCNTEHGDLMMLNAYLHICAFSPLIPISMAHLPPPSAAAFFQLEPRCSCVTFHGARGCLAQKDTLLHPKNSVTQYNSISPNIQKQC